MRIRFACFGPFIAFARPSPGALADEELGGAARLKGLASVMDGSKLCPFGTCARPHSGRHLLAAHIIAGVGNPGCAYRAEPPGSGTVGTQHTGAAGKQYIAPLGSWA